MVDMLAVSGAGVEVVAGRDAGAAVGGSGAAHGAAEGVSRAMCRQPGEWAARRPGPGGRLRAVEGPLGSDEAEAAVRCASEAAEVAAEAAQSRDANAAEAAASTAVDAALCACAGRLGAFEEASAAFAERLDGLNRQIRSYNLVVPSTTSQVLALKLEVERDKALADVCARAVEMRRAAASREAMRAVASGADRDAFGVLALSGSLSGGWAQAEPVNHGILASLASVLWR